MIGACTCTLEFALVSLQQLVCSQLGMFFRDLMGLQRHQLPEDQEGLDDYQVAPSNLVRESGG